VSVTTFCDWAAQLGPISSCSTVLACSTKTGNSLILRGTMNLCSSCFSLPLNFLHLHSSVTTGVYKRARYSNLLMYASTVMVPYYNVRNSASCSCLALFGKYFSKNLIMKVAQVTYSSRVCINYYIPCHQYSTSATRRNVTNNSFCSSVHSNTR